MPVEPREQMGEVALARLDEALDLGQLRQPQGGLHVGGLQVVADVAVDVLVVVAGRKVAELPLEALVAGVVLARLAVAVPAPVTEGLDLLLDERGLDEDRAALHPS